MIVNSHIKGLKGIHDRLKKNASTVSVKRVCQEEIDQEIVEIKERPGKMMELL